MQSCSDAPVDVFKKLSIAENLFQINGKENCMTSSACLLQKHSVQNTVPHGPKKSKLPVFSKAKEPPDFQKMHQTWQNHFQRGKAVCKKTCTRPQPFNFSQRGERSRVQISGASPIGQQSNSPASYNSREPLAEVALGQNKTESNVVKGGSEVAFKADPAALASILSNIGVSAAPVGKVSLAQRVPVRASSIAHSLNSNKNMMIRSSLYTVPQSHTLPANLNRMTCYSKITDKANEKKSLYRPQTKNSVLETTAGLKEKLHQQENPVLQQMNPSPHVPVSDKSSCSLVTQDNLMKLTSLPAITDKTSTAVSTPLCETSSTELNGSAEKKHSVKKTDIGSVDFVADSQALANILSNTEMNNANCRKLSLAQRVPMQGRSSMFKGSVTTPKHAYGPMSNVTVPLKELMFSPCRVPLVTSDMNSGGSAIRVPQMSSFSVKFSQRYSLMSKPPVFPKTPRALALEKANKCHETEKDVQASSKSTVKWADQLSPSPLSEALCDHETDMEKVAMRLFLDGEGPGILEKKKELTAMSDPLIVLERSPTSTPQQKGLLQPVAHRANIGDSQNFNLHSQMHLAPSLQPSSSESTSSVVSSVPLSFLSHPAVQALQSHTLVPCSLPDIARIRLQAAVSAKQRFWEARLDEECAFYTSRDASGTNRSCRDPVSIFLDKQEDMHFTPICPEES
ncbi:tastin [Mantella aurantiaca]